MKYLLDTHVWLWSLLDPARLRAGTAQQLRQKTNRLYLSPVSVWEALLLVERQRVIVDGDPVRFVDRALERSRPLEAPLTFDVARESRRLHLEHQDPADRFLAATARVYRLTLITADARLLASKEIKVLAA